MSRREHWNRYGLHEGSGDREMSMDIARRALDIVDLVTAEDAQDKDISKYRKQILDIINIENLAPKKEEEILTLVEVYKNQESKNNAQFLRDFVEWRKRQKNTTRQVPEYALLENMKLNDLNFETIHGYYQKLQDERRKEKRSQETYDHLEVNQWVEDESDMEQSYDISEILKKYETIKKSDIDRILQERFDTQIKVFDGMLDKTYQQFWDEHLSYSYLQSLIEAKLGSQDWYGGWSEYKFQALEDFRQLKEEYGFPDDIYEIRKQFGGTPEFSQLLKKDGELKHYFEEALIEKQILMEELYGKLMNHITLEFYDPERRNVA